MNWWLVAAAANVVIAGAYVAISARVSLGLTRSRQWTTNPLGAATAGIFFTCGFQHGSHAAHMLLPLAGLEEASGAATREALGEWHVWSWDVLTAAVAVWYWSLRGRFPALVRGTALFEDLRQRERQALEINDEVVQGLAVAKYALDAGDAARARDAIDVTLARSRRIIGDLLGAEGTETRLGPGDLRRERAAAVLTQAR